ncbi:pentatricopeptide repeat-containing protein At2g22410, mitochondrial-like [Gastrolobium bilobum]|uniref:pentatricopeptide repeat-containing protein At2g22410, mitochondrial-like n=1 Tax=Gastrolobium bilobum TaxID=150636 RepID=UPI002AB2FDDB|nr:pentatricopeptide repeat-containing protein At2g22410, mitochondrial-like [Gastrolobium bilobum]
MNYALLQKALHNCASVDHLKRIHALCVTLGFLHKHNLQQPLSCKLLQSYKSVGKTEQAQRVFNQIQEPDIVSWTCLLNLYLHSGLPTKSLLAYSHFVRMGLRPDSFVVVAALSSCGHCKDLVRGRVVHGMVLRNHLDENHVVGNALIDMYCRNGMIGVAALVFEKMGFRDVFSWTSLVNGYILCNNLDTARRLFDAMPERNVISWTAMIVGCVKEGAPIQALKLFKQMEADGEAPPCANSIVAVLSGCADVGALDFGQCIHGCVQKTSLILDVTVSNAMMDMYSKSGRLDLAVRIFDEILKKDLFSWTTMISGYAYHGEGHHALDVYSRMLESGFTPNEVTLLSVLTACSHAGLVVEGKVLFSRMIQCHYLKPKIEHYGCIVDLLGRAGLLEEAKEVIELMPISPDAAIWRSLLNACSVRGNFRMAQIAGKKVIELEPNDDGVYMLICNMYCAASMWKEASDIRRLMRKRRIKKRPGCSWVDINGVVQEFLAEETSLHVNAELCFLLKGIKQHRETCLFANM